MIQLDVKGVARVHSLVQRVRSLRVAVADVNSLPGGGTMDLDVYGCLVTFQRSYVLERIEREIGLAVEELGKLGVALTD